MSLGGGGYGFEVVAAAWFESPRDSLRMVFPRMGRASARRPSSGRTSAERLRDLRNARRDEDKWNNTFPGLARAKICRCCVLYGQMTIEAEGRERIHGSLVLRTFLR
jgi:hypothetical protein